MLNLLDLESLNWESLHPNGQEWIPVVLEARQGWQEILGKQLTPKEVFDLEFDKDAKAELLAQM